MAEQLPNCTNNALSSRKGEVSQAEARPVLAETVQDAKRFVFFVWYQTRCGSRQPQTTTSQRSTSSRWDQ
ncbi:hypothetical protein G6F51_014445 [Rhizopus arrhizus]|uniref:Uncharacterized protein n=1 Tax=Rhizopus oryzae TaxID=64495 RepID=A0A9P6XMA8_RHIOR|nr:hypothetical protein G6F51_014445 [Rhizopus arrhizus]